MAGFKKSKRSSVSRHADETSHDLPLLPPSPPSLSPLPLLFPSPVTVLTALTMPSGLRHGEDRHRVVCQGETGVLICIYIYHHPTLTPSSQPPAAIPGTPPTPTLTLGTPSTPYVCPPPQLGIRKVMVVMCGTAMVLRKPLMNMIREQSQVRIMKLRMQSSVPHGGCRPRKSRRRRIKTKKRK